jgi:hypothetical protein
VQGCPELLALADEAELLKLAARRLARRQLAPPLTDVARLQLLNGLQADARYQREAADAYEDAALVCLWDRESQSSPSAQRVTQDLRTLKRRILAAGFPDPNRIEVLLVADVHAWLCELLAAWRSLQQGIQVVQVVERHGAEIRVRPLAELPYRATVLEQPPPSVIGLTLAIEGELCAALFASEVGVHVWRPPRDAGAPRFALLRATDAAAEVDVTQLRALAESALPRIREFDHDKATMHEGKWRQPWDQRAPRHRIAERMRERLAEAIDRIGDTQ